MADKRVEFPPPAGFQLPEGVQAGEDFDLVCTFRTKSNGDICLVQMGDVKMPGYDKERGETKKQDYSDYLRSMQSARSASMEQANGTSPAY